MCSAFKFEAQKRIGTEHLSDTINVILKRCIVLKESDKLQEDADLVKRTKKQTEPLARRFFFKLQSFLRIISVRVVQKPFKFDF